MHPAKVLIAEDDLAVLRSLQQILLTRPELTVETAEDGVEAWEKAQAMQPDLILSDYEMPGMSGFDFCRKVKEDSRLSTAMFVILSGHTDTNLKVMGLNLGVDDYITKPIDSTELLAKLKASLRLKALHDRLRDRHDELEESRDRLGHSLDRLLQVLLHLIDLRLPGAGTRSQWLADKAVSLADKMDVPSQYHSDLVLAARLHEIGKLVTVEGSGAGPWNYLQSSVAILEPIDRFTATAGLLRAVGENWDGTGVPNHLQRGQVPLRARILRVLIEMLSGTESGGGLANESVASALDRVERYAGTRFDPLVVTQLRSMIERAETDWRPNKQRIPVDDLAEGMVLADDLCTASGTKLLSRGATITATTLNIIQKRHTSDPVLYGAWVAT